MLCVIFTLSSYAQATVLGTQTVNGSYTTFDLTDLGIFRQVRVQATSSDISGARNWLFCKGSSGSPDYTTKWEPYFCCYTLAAYNQTIPHAPLTACANAVTFGGNDGYMPAVTLGNYYTFNITEYSVPATPADEYMGVLETIYNPVSISTVTQSPDKLSVTSCDNVIITVTTSAPPSSGENIYLRYSTTLSFTSSTLVSVSMVGATGTATIPLAAVGTTIYYYVYSSPNSYAAISADVVANGEVAHDMNALNLNNNGGPNYNYTVTATPTNFCGNYYVPSTCFPTIASFVTALNAGTVTCPVVCNVSAGYTETAPVGGINLTKTGTIANTITFQKNGAGSNPIIYAAVGTVSIAIASVTSDGIFSLSGCDYITIDGIDLQDNNASAPATMEYGYGLFKASATDGCQNNTIKNCSITLKSSNSGSGPFAFEDGSRGIFMGNVTRTAIGTNLTIATATGRNDNNTFIGNTIKNVHNGIIIRGFLDASPFTYYDQNNVVGQSGAGNTIENYGGAGGASYAVYTIYQANASISYNSINNTASGGSAHTSTLYGIYYSANMATGNTYNVSVNYNTVSLTQGSNSSIVYCIRVGAANYSAGTVNINYNTIQNCSYTSGASGAFYGIYHDFSPAVLSISNNTIKDNTLNTTSSTFSALIYDNTNSVSSTISNNILTNNNKSGVATGFFYGYYNNSAAAVSSSTSISGNYIDGLYVPLSSGAAVAGIFLVSAGTNQTKTITNNRVYNIIAGTGALYTSGIIIEGMPTGSSVTYNRVANIASAANTCGINCGKANVGTSVNLSYDVSNNYISDISTSGSSIQALVVNSAATTSTITCATDTINNITCSFATTSPNVRGLLPTGGASTSTYIIHNCIISGVSHTGGSGTCFVSGLVNFSSASLQIYNNTISGISTNTTSAGQAFGIYFALSSATMTIYNNYIQKISASSSTHNTAVIGIYFATATTYNIYYNTIALGKEGTLSGGTGFGCAGINFGSGSSLNLRNNIIYVSATASGAGSCACLRRISASAAGTAPSTSNFSSTSNNNFYYINYALWNYIYVEGATSGLAGTMKNGFAWSGATTSATYNLNNDPCFNVASAAPYSYKTFMSPRESNSFYDVPPFVGGATIPQNLKLTTSSTSYAESHAVNIAGITTDWEGDIRQGNAGYGGTGTAPDIGADEGEFTALVADCNLLPIDLASFTGWFNETLQANELHWITLSEKNAQSFEIQKSIDAENFNAIGNVAAKGNSTSEIAYVFYDENPYTGINYYRLKMIDLDGSYKYSKIIAIDIHHHLYTDISIYPNPVKQNITLEYTSGDDKELIAEIRNIWGEKINSQRIDIHEGINSVIIKTENLPQAHYFLVVSDIQAGEIATFKFIKASN